MSAPICGARTLRITFEGPSGEKATIEIDPTTARNVASDIQRQLDALDRDAAIADAERRMIEAHRRARDLSDMEDNALDQRLRSRLVMAMTRAYAETSRLGEEWLALVEAHATNGGGV